jgi:hypothetical protein
MSVLLSYTFYYLFGLFAISSISSGWILFRTRNSADALIFIALTTNTFALFSTTFFGGSISFDGSGEILSEIKPMLSFNKIMWLHLIAAISFSAGFTIKAFSTTKN